MSPPDNGPESVEGELLAEIEAGLANLSANVDGWINERFLAPAAEGGSAPPPELDVADVNGLIAWLGQWHDHFEGFSEDAEKLNEAGRPAVAERLAAIHTEIDKSIENFTQLAQSLPNPLAG